MNKLAPQQVIYYSCQGFEWLSAFINGISNTRNSPIYGIFGGSRSVGLRLDAFRLPWVSRPADGINFSKPGIIGL